MKAIRTMAGCLLMATALASMPDATAKPVKVKLKNPGELEQKLPESKASKGSPLIIEGAMNNDDVRYLRSLCGGDSLFKPVVPIVTEIDLSGVSFFPDATPAFATGTNSGQYKITSQHSIPAGMFYDCPITKLTLPERLDSIGRIAFYGTSLKELYVQDGVHVDKQAIYLDSCLEVLRLPYMAEAISPSRNHLPALKSVTYAGFDYMSGGSFEGHQAIEEIIVDGLIGHMDGYTITECPNIRRVEFRGPICSTGGKRFTKDCPALEEVTIENLALTYGLINTIGSDHFKGFKVDGAVLESSDTVLVAQTPASFIVKDPRYIPQIEAIGEWQIKQMTAPQGGFLRYVSHLGSENTLELAREAGLDDLVVRIEKAREIARTFDDMKSRLQILKESPAYKADSVEWTHRFALPSDSMLTLTRDRFNLDSIAGQGDDISRIKNLLYWLHDLVRHDGVSPWPRCGLNCREIYDVCQRDNRGVNCRMMAIMLTEALLAEGIPSRYITCESKAWDTDPDCHVICVAWSESLGKWVWVDPTFAAYVTDENGVMLHPGEVRYRLQHDLPLVLNEDANWNHEEKQTKEGYLEDYMAKNLYIMSCNTFNQANPEGPANHEKGEVVALVPVGSNYNRNNVNTSDESRFWAPPTAY